MCSLDCQHLVSKIIIDYPISQDSIDMTSSQGSLEGGRGDTYFLAPFHLGQRLYCVPLRLSGGLAWVLAGIPLSLKPQSLIRKLSGEGNMWVVRDDSCVLLL